ncbi:hypothetical protein C5E07_18800 [Pseudoclavibacter sp. RFBJ3]|nr:hypothetical protein C5C12_18875 [Pseudoclavibacter sp. RFBJ5]PPF88699.1 hypothetical protein C5E07_18800 [Pseudoclavibacter sp. RFBJ3]PPF94253.1 hypothetical protein C5C19_18700 [Pseudoclavibacter sp. RFBH5]PPG18244.1 hypothetical protein C5E13_18505 [Pseudoclavibacter sp. RFBI4]
MTVKEFLLNEVRAEYRARKARKRFERTPRGGHESFSSQPVHSCIATCAYVWWTGVVNARDGLSETAQLFKVLGSKSRLLLVRLISEGPSPVNSLVERSGLSQPLVSQHLRNLRSAGVVTSTRSGREVLYQLADHHIAHVIDDAITHVLEEHSQT